MTTLFYWLVSCLESVSSDEELTFTSIYETYIDDVTDLNAKPCSRYMLSRAIHVTFPNVTIHRKKVRGVRDTYYANLRWRTPTCTRVVASTFRCPTGYSVVFREDPDKLYIDKDLGMIVNDTYPLILHIEVNGCMWEAYICSKKMDKAILGLDCSVEWTQECLEKILQVLNAFKLCIGRSNGATGKNVVEEHVAYVCANESFVKYRNRCCERLIPPTAYGDVCKVCLKGIRGVESMEIERASSSDAEEVEATE